MYCKNCGFKLKNNDKFCGKCGKAVENKTEPQEVEIIEIEEKEKKVESLTSNKYIYTIIALTMLFSFGLVIICSFI